MQSANSLNFILYLGDKGDGDDFPLGAAECAVEAVDSVPLVLSGLAAHVGRVGLSVGSVGAVLMKGAKGHVISVSLGFSCNITCYWILSRKKFKLVLDGVHNLNQFKVSV